MKQRIESFKHAPTDYEPEPQTFRDRITIGDQSVLTEWDDEIPEEDPGAWDGDSNATPGHELCYSNSDSFTRR